MSKENDVLPGARSHCGNNEPHGAHCQEERDFLVCLGTPEPPKRTVHWYTCECEYWSKYCDEHHRKFATIPVSVLNQYTDPE